MNTSSSAPAQKTYRKTNPSKKIALTGFVRTHCNNLGHHVDGQTSESRINQEQSAINSLFNTFLKDKSARGDLGFLIETDGSISEDTERKLVGIGKKAKGNYGIYLRKLFDVAGKQTDEERSDPNKWCGLTKDQAKDLHDIVGFEIQMPNPSPKIADGFVKKYCEALTNSSTNQKALLAINAVFNEFLKDKPARGNLGFLIEADGSISENTEKKLVDIATKGNYTFGLRLKEFFEAAAKQTDDERSDPNKWCGLTKDEAEALRDVTDPARIRKDRDQKHVTGNLEALGGEGQPANLRKTVGEWNRSEDGKTLTDDRTTLPVKDILDANLKNLDIRVGDFDHRQGQFPFLYQGEPFLNEEGQPAGVTTNKLRELTDGRDAAAAARRTLIAMTLIPRSSTGGIQIDRDRVIDGINELQRLRTEESGFGSTPKIRENEKMLDVLLTPGLADGIRNQLNILIKTNSGTNLAIETQKELALLSKLEHQIKQPDMPLLYVSSNALHLSETDERAALDSLNPKQWLNDDVLGQVFRGMNKYNAENAAVPNAAYFVTPHEMRAMFEPGYAELQVR